MDYHEACDLLVSTGWDTDMTFKELMIHILALCALLTALALMLGV